MTKDSVRNPGGDGESNEFTAAVKNGRTKTAGETNAARNSRGMTWAAESAVTAIAIGCAHAGEF